jgi:hypothetical protein
VVGRRSAQGFDPRFGDCLGDKKGSHMTYLLSGVGLRSEVAAVGAQAERRGFVLTVRNLQVAALS